MSAVTLPITFAAVGSAAPGAPFAPVSRTISALQADEVLVRVSHASVNAMDGKVHAYNFPKLPLPMVVGYDFSGVVAALGTPGAFPGETEPVKVGSAVIGTTFGIGWGGGCFAEYVVSKRDRVALRDEVPSAEASTFGLAFLGAYDSLCVATDIRQQAGQTIYILGGAGGVGHFAVQLSKAYGLRVITSASKPAGLELLRKLGADVVFDYTMADAAKEVLAATGGRGADIVFDATYADSSFKQSASVVAKGGKWIRMGGWMMSPPELKAHVEATVTERGATMAVGDLARYTMDPAYKAKVPQLQAGLPLARQLYAEGRLQPYITATVPLEAAAVQRAVQDKSAVGKVVVVVP